MQNILSRLKNRKGFTFIELVVVVAIISILAAVAMSDVSQTVSESKASRAQSDIKVIADAAQKYFADMGTVKDLEGNGGTYCAKLTVQADSTVDGKKKGPWLKKCPTNGPWPNKQYKIDVSDDATGNFNVWIEDNSGNTYQMLDKTVKK